MKSCEDQKELIAAIETSLEKYLAEFTDILEGKKDARLLEGERTPSEHLSYQLGWVSSLLDWERREQAGQTVQTPAEGYTWNNLSGLYQQFYATYGGYTLAEQQQMLREKVAELCSWVENLSETEFFTPEQRAWATASARWPIWKWVNINTVAPFTNFCMHIRKWKRAAQV
ncbi:ClbS/DfsB family four-helix bundle protein [Rothia sp. HMSC08A08]|uniref:ClbS/DfsB family four-helix bundle protein n=1 Tax=Rothia sp. HMSC08A08 TaxID=1581132 RepID=UPI0008A176DA|nr:ClbS/DfsB family four-helix bundle protein [Rothia sp. HMSC08A08]OFS81825.1 hypothetical protein HMPREF3164_02915 [Rothia sp. HMSC08A08]